MVWYIAGEKYMCENHNLIFDRITPVPEIHCSYSLARLRIGT